MLWKNGVWNESVARELNFLDAVDVIPQYFCCKATTKTPRFHMLC